MPETNTAELERKRNSAFSRSSLLEAAAELFASQGYEQTTVREIGRAANVDPTLIARYFGSKAALYLESLRGQSADGLTTDLRDAAAVRELLDRVAPRGPSPTLYAAVRPHEDPELQAAAMEVLGRRVTQPVEAQVRAAGLDKSDLRAEIATAALAGIVLSRTAKALPALTAAGSSEVAELVATLMRSLTE
jgi:AcrR family transcriptional regulator